MWWCRVLSVDFDGRWIVAVEGGVHLSVIYITKEAIHDCIQLIRHTVHAWCFEARKRECLLLFAAMTRSRCISAIKKGEYHDFTDGSPRQSRQCRHGFVEEW